MSNVVDRGRVNTYFDMSNVVRHESRWCDTVQASECVSIEIYKQPPSSERVNRVLIVRLVFSSGQSKRGLIRHFRLSCCRQAVSCHNEVVASGQSGELCLGLVTAIAERLLRQHIATLLAERARRLNYERSRMARGSGQMADVKKGLDVAGGVKEAPARADGLRRSEC
ncbi:hypothetical protein EJ05DRAFT_482405 [Pseudovirgaria hyperparasitica]|uniref:Uncharacterized protein n=1 Tax=Pseudovirgaria hyperparasitica TaxID=470096 RepID=A0A6A6WFD4_9PEZI|nr:uncharacterized protein EJ05DRAFT_482405 [Pseudovirgaria hyperparasitica]KAF2761532.1 hypothetical protein EJ05DRAFT_482405 [Pseudovirgaria hyperparasitica]